MNGEGTLRWGLVLVLSIGVVATGCAKKQTVRSETAGESVAAHPVNPVPVETAKTPAQPAELPVATTPPVPSAGIAVTEEMKSPFADIHFDFDKSFIKNEDRPVLRNIATFMTRHPNVRLRVEGNCDERGTSEYNMALGERRAESARKYIADLGIPASRISTISFGKEKPLDSGHDEAAWAKNRRDHFDNM